MYVVLTPASVHVCVGGWLQIVSFWGMLLGLMVFLWYFIWGQPGHPRLDNVGMLDTKYGLPTTMPRLLHATHP